MEEFGRGYCTYSDSSPTPFHAVKTSAEFLDDAGFERVFENSPWRETIKKGGKYYLTRNGSTLCAFVIGDQYVSGNGFKIVGAHSDSLVLKVKPVSKKEGNGVEQIKVETYGGGLWHTWFDRDLGIAGRVIVRLESGECWQQLVHINRPILRIANLAIHLQSTEERNGFAPNKETELVPILSSLESELNAPTTVKSKNKKKNKSKSKVAELERRHSPKLLTLLARELEVEPEDIVDFELTLCPTQPAAIGGAMKEFIFAPRMDNQLHCYVGSKAFVESSKNTVGEKSIRMFFMFDHEEVGSGSNEGAGSPIMRDTCERLFNTFYDLESSLEPQRWLAEELFKVALAKSILWSSDCIHALHPNYAHKHDSNLAPLMGDGTALSISSNQDFATNAVTAYVLKELARQNKVGYIDPHAETGFSEIPMQEFMGVNTQASGSTIGPHLAKGVGIRTVDCGIPQLSMHSIREQCAVKDLFSTFFLFQAFFKFGLDVDESLSPPDFTF